MRLLDGGCGPGSITVGLARIVAPGQTIGVDLEPRQIERARLVAAWEGATNLSFAVANIYALPFADATFDVVFAHTVLEHLSDPGRVLRELRRVLTPGGVVGVRDPDYGAGVWEPTTSLLAEVSHLLLRIREHHGGSPCYARHQRQLLREAGFVRVQAYTFAECQGSAAATRAFAELIAEVLHDPATIEVAVEQGWADRRTIDAMTAEVRAWGERSDAFRAILDCAAVGWVPDDGDLTTM